jgi:hypothetical protein
MMALLLEVMMKSLLLILALIFSTFAIADDAMITVKGTIVHDVSNPFSYQGEFVFTPNTTVTIKLSTCTGDGSCYTAFKKTLSGMMAFPIPFEITTKKGVYALDVSVRSNGGKAEVGDLINEYFILVKDSQEIEVKASGLEACGSEGSGGFCL